MYPLFVDNSIGKQNIKDYIYPDDIRMIMGKKAYSQAFSDNAHNKICKKRFDCGSLRCPNEENLSKFPEASNFPCFKDNTSMIMGKKVYSQTFSYTTRPIFCKKRFVCGAFKCPDENILSKFPEGSNFPCFIEKINQNQHRISFDYIKKEWKEANKITWRDVFSFEDRWLTIPYIIVVFLFLTHILIFFVIIP